MWKALTKEEFIEKARKIHGDKYDYSKVDYVHSKLEVTIICPIHGEFTQRPNDHLSGHGCLDCGNIKKVENRKISTEEFIERSKKIHGDKYDYSKTDLSNKDEKGRIIIICPKHGEFKQTPHMHMSGQGCSKCYDENRGIKKKNTIRLRVLEKIHKLYDNYYKIIDESYEDYEKNMILICDKHGAFYRTPHTLLKGNCRCEKCNSSHLENEIRESLKNKNTIFDEQKRFKWLGRQTLDFYIPSKNIAIECQGEQHFKTKNFFGGEKGFVKTIKRDEKKKQLCEEHGIKILYYSNLGIDYPYHVFENKEELLEEIKKYENDFNEPQERSET